MTLRNALVAAAVALGLVTWHSELWRVTSRAATPRPLMLGSSRPPAPPGLDVSLPAVPIGMERVRPDDAVLVLHYWAPWEQHGLVQAQMLDSLRREPEMEGLRVALVCSDPFPSVARYVGRHRLRLLVLLDGAHELRKVLPCPALPYTYVVDRTGRIAVAQEGEVAWLAPATRELLRGLIAESRDAKVALRKNSVLSHLRNAM